MLRFFFFGEYTNNVNKTRIEGKDDPKIVSMQIVMSKIIQRLSFQRSVSDIFPSIQLIKTIEYFGKCLWLKYL
jgi:hypothetical protein